MKGWLGLHFYKSKIKSPAMKTQDKMNNKGKQWQATERGAREDFDYLPWQRGQTLK
jgi:hypothetical protein